MWQAECAHLKTWHIESYLWDFRTLRILGTKCLLHRLLSEKKSVSGLSLLLVGVEFLGYQQNKHFQRPPEEDEISFIFMKLYSWVSKVPFPLNPVIEA